MSDVPLVSIATPSLNQADFLPQTVESVRLQDYPNIEHLVIDGGSTDGTLDFLKECSETINGFKYISEPDNGQSSAVNKGWRMAEGCILGWLNSDDAYKPGAVSRVVNFFKRHPSAAVVYGDCDYVDEHGDFIQRYPTRPYDFLELVKTSDNFIPQPSVFMRGWAPKAVGYLNESLHFIMDFEYWLRIGLLFKMAYLPVCLSTLRLHQRAKSVDRMAGFAEEFISVYNSFFELSAIPESVREIRREAISNIYYRSASYLYWSGNFGRALRFGWRAWQLQPWKIRPLYPFFLLNGLGASTAKKLAGGSFSGNLIGEKIGD